MLTRIALALCLALPAFAAAQSPAESPAPTPTPAQSPAQSPARTDEPRVTNAWARATPGAAETAAAYLTIVSAVPDRLVSVATPAARQAELHRMAMDGNVMRMRPLAAIDLPAGTAVTLKPGADHIMLLGLAKPLREGDRFALTLEFEKAGKREVSVAVEKPGAMGPSGTAPPPAASPAPSPGP